MWSNSKPNFGDPFPRGRDRNSYQYTQNWTEEGWKKVVNLIGNNDPHETQFIGHGDFTLIRNIANEQWEEIGRKISNNTHLKDVCFSDGALNDDQISFLFRGLTRSDSMINLCLHNNVISAAGLRCMEPMLINATNLIFLDLYGNNMRSEGFNLLLRTFRDSSIQDLSCRNCGIESIDIDIDHFPRKLKVLFLCENNINADDGCRVLAKLLQGEDSTLTQLYLHDNKVDDEGVAFLVDALQSNSSLISLGLQHNDGISKKGLVMLLKLVNDISSINATLRSNHSVIKIYVGKYADVEFSYRISLTDRGHRTRREPNHNIHRLIGRAVYVNRLSKGPEEAGKEKLNRTLLSSAIRDELAELQGVNQSLYSEINSLCLPEVLSLVGRRHGQGELYVALKSSVAGVISTVNRRQCIKQRLADLVAESAELDSKSSIAEVVSTVNRKEYIMQQRDYHLAKADELTAELAASNAAEGGVVDTGNDESRRKRRRKWWWGLWVGK